MNISLFFVIPIRSDRLTLVQNKTSVKNLSSKDAAEHCSCSNGGNEKYKSKIVKISRLTSSLRPNCSGSRKTAVVTEGGKCHEESCRAQTHSKPQPTSWQLQRRAFIITSTQHSTAVQQTEPCICHSLVSFYRTTYFGPTNITHQPAPTRNFARQ